MYHDNPPEDKAHGSPWPSEGGHGFREGLWEGADFCPAGGHLVKSSDIFGCHNLRIGTTGI